MMLFSEVARRVKDRYGADYTETNFVEVLAPALEKLGKKVFTKPGTSHKTLYELLLHSLKSNFKL